MQKISICVTYYNQENFVKDSLNSILSIDFPCDYEVLVGNDGSTDNTGLLVDEYVNRYPDKIKHYIWDRKSEYKSINRASMNRLNLAEKATGNYIIFMDGDDYFCDREFIKNALLKFQRYPNIQVCSFNFKFIFKERSEQIFTQCMTEGVVPSREYIANSFYTPAPCCVFKNSFNKSNIEMLKRVNNFDDNAITIFMLQYGDLYYIDNVIYAYNQNDDSLWNRVSQFEKYLIESFDYNQILKTAPKFKVQLAKRFYHDIKFLFKNRNKMTSLGKDKLDYYLTKADSAEDNLIYGLLSWTSSSFVKKIHTYYLFLKFKLLVKF